MIGMAENHPDEEPVYRFQVVFRRMKCLLLGLISQITDHLDGDERKSSLRKLSLRAMQAGGVQHTVKSFKLLSML
jgi:hypothetical protein